MRAIISKLGSLKSFTRKPAQQELYLRTVEHFLYTIDIADHHRIKWTQLLSVRHNRKCHYDMMSKQSFDVMGYRKKQEDIQYKVKTA